MYVCMYIYLYMKIIYKGERIKDSFTLYKVCGKVKINSYLRCWGFYLRNNLMYVNK